MTAARCQRPGCGRRLTAEASVEAGYSKACAAKERAELREAALRQAVAIYSDQQVKDATALIAAGKVRPRGDREGAWLATSRDGKRTYFTCSVNCTCAAGQNGRPCCHMAAVALIEAYQQFDQSYRKAA